MWFLYVNLYSNTLIEVLSDTCSDLGVWQGACTKSPASPFPASISLLLSTRSLMHLSQMHLGRCVYGPVSCFLTLRVSRGEKVLVIPGSCRHGPLGSPQRRHFYSPAGRCTHLRPNQNYKGTWGTGEDAKSISYLPGTPLLASLAKIDSAKDGDGKLGGYRGSQPRLFYLQPWALKVGRRAGGWSHRFPGSTEFHMGSGQPLWELQVALKYH